MAVSPIKGRPLRWLGRNAGAAGLQIPVRRAEGAGARAARAEEREGKNGKSAGAVAARILCASVVSKLGKSEPSCAPVRESLSVSSHHPVGSSH